MSIIEIKEFKLLPSPLSKLLVRILYISLIYNYIFVFQNNSECIIKYTFFSLCEIIVSDKSILHVSNYSTCFWEIAHALWNIFPLPNAISVERTHVHPFLYKNEKCCYGFVSYLFISLGYI